MTRFALILAANKFADPRISHRRYAEQDAQVLAGVLRESDCFATVKPLVGSALRKEVALATAREFALRLASEGGGLLKIFFSGHWYHHQGMDLLVCPAARLDELNEFCHGISVDSLRAVTAQPGVDRLQVTDFCCANLRADLRNLVAVADTASREGAQATLSGCSAGESSFALPGLRHGAFAYAYVETLSQAHAEGREVRLDDTLMTAVRERLAATLHRHGYSRRQTPSFQLIGEAPVILPGRPRTLPRDNPPPEAPRGSGG